MTFKNRNILVVGGRTGIGRSLVEKLSGSGATLWCASRQPADNYAALGVNYVELDVTSEDLSALTQTLPAELHGLAFCPGTIILRPFHALKIDDFRHELEVNLLGAIKVLQACREKLMAPKGASVVLFSTVAAALGMNYHSSISAAKAAVEGLARALALEWAPHRIRINVVAPSLTDTPLATRLLADDKRREASAARHPLGRVGDPADQAAAAMFLLGDDASWITGQTIGVDGGMGKLKPL